MAQKPDGKPARTERVTFTRPAAERIARVVRKVEQGNRDCGGLTFGRVGSGGGVRLQVATFTGSWATGTYKTVTLSGSTATASVYNWCNPAEGDTANTGATQYVLFGRASGTNSVLEIQMRSTSVTCRMSINGMDLTQLPGYSAGSIQLLGHSAKDMTTNNTACATLTWYSITTCSTSA